MSASVAAAPQFFESRTLRIGILVVLLAAGLGIRLFDLTDLPLDFHPTRQLLSAIKARGMYYQHLAVAPEWQRDFAIREWALRAHVEPEVFERLVAITYRATGEHVWVARIYSSVFWTLGALFLFSLARRLVSHDGALVTTTVYLLLPYGVTASRSFQPDPLMVVLVIVFWWALVRWADSAWASDGATNARPSTRPGDRKAPAGSLFFATLAGLAGGVAIFIKLVAVFFIIPVAGATLLGRERIRSLVRRPELWLMVILGALPAALYLIYGILYAGFLGQQFEGRFFPALLVSPSYYAGWINVLNLVVGPSAVLLGLLGILVSPNRLAARLLIALWFGYLLYGLFFNYHISTHDYYSLILVPIVSLSLAPLGAHLLSILAARASRPGPRAASLAVMGITFVLILVGLRQQLSRVDFHPDAEMWREIGETLGPEARVLALTQDYGMRLIYWGWLAPTPWPSASDLRYHALRGASRRFESEFARLSRNRDYFLVTDFDELARQPDLAAKLGEFDVVAERPRYVILDLSPRGAE